jgi:hypothetical protein
MFWDALLLRFHFGFKALPDGLEYASRALGTAYAPRQRLFTVLPSGQPQLPQLSDFSVWLLTQDCPVTTLLGQHAYHRLNDLNLRQPPLRPDISSFPTLLEANAPVNVARGLAAAREEDLVREAQALMVVGPSLRRRMTEFRARVWMQPPVELIPAVYQDFPGWWNQVRDSRRLKPEDLPLHYFRLDVENELRHPHRSPARICWDSRPTWIDPWEWAFLRACYNSDVSPVDRLALFLLIYGALDVAQITRLFWQLHTQTGWPFPLTAAGYTAAMDHLVRQWAAVLRYMARDRAARVAAS